MDSAVNPLNTNHVLLPPHTVRIKRKRGQDPIQALLIDEQARSGSRKKRSRTDSYVFKLAGTFENEPAAPGDVLLHQDNNTHVEEQPDKRVFRLPKRSRTSDDGDGAIPLDDPEVSQSLTEMVQSYLGLDENKPISPLRNAGQSGATLDSTLIEGAEQADDYVYDIYYRERYTDDDNLDKSKIGFIVLLDSDLEDLGAEDELDSNAGGTDDEDSNAEDFYRNDYPDEVSGDEENDPSDDENQAIDRHAPVSKFDLRKVDRSEGDSMWDEVDGEGDIDDDYDVDLDEDEEDDDYDTHSPKDEIGEEQWSEDEDLEQYRNRILGELETSLRE